MFFALALDLNRFKGVLGRIPDWLPSVFAEEVQGPDEEGGYYCAGNKTHDRLDDIAYDGADKGAPWALLILKLVCSENYKSLEIKLLNEKKRLKGGPCHCCQDQRRGDRDSI